VEKKDVMVMLVQLEMVLNSQKRKLEGAYLCRWDADNSNHRRGRDGCYGSGHTQQTRLVLVAKIKFLLIITVLLRENRNRTVHEIDGLTLSDQSWIQG
jgi:hypothetical protein